MLSSCNNNFAEPLRQRLPAQVFNLIRKIGNLAQERGFSAYIVGGFVRDFLLGIGNLDLDIVLETDALDFVKILKDKFKLNVVTHRRFGTATVTMPSGFKIDIASAREEYYPYASALPAITYSSIKEDLFRRDFTINALAIKINRDNFGQLLDLFDGLKDLTEGKIRVLHGKSFIDDPTRILRAIRFEQRYNFTIEENTARLIEQAKRKGMLRKLSRFRVGDELILILKEEDPLKSLKRIYRLCGLGFIHPLIKIDKMVSRQFESIKREVILFRRNHAGRSLENWLIYFMILTFRLSLPQIKRLCRDFCLTRRDVRKIDLFKRNATRTIKLIDKDKSMPAHRVYEILSHFSDEAILALLCLAETRRARIRIKLFLNKLSQVKIELRGQDLKRLKLKPGPKYRNILQKVLYAKIDGKLKSRSDELNYARYILNK